MLRFVSYVWSRPAGPAPAQLFRERADQLARFHGPLAPLSPTRVGGESATARIVLEEFPDRNVVLGTYAAPR